MSTLKMTFSLASLILIFALAAIPAMAATIEAEWDGTAGTNGQWSVTVIAAAVDATTAATVTAFDLSITNPADTEPAGTLAVTAGTTIADGEHTMSVDADPGHRVAVRVVIVGGDDAGTYQRVTLPVAADLAETDLVLIPKLKKLTEDMYYVNFGSPTATVKFEFADVMADSDYGAATALLHVSDVTVNPTANWQIVSVSGTDTVMIRAIHASNADSVDTIVSLNDTYAMPTAATVVNTDTVQGDGEATVKYDNTAPAVTIPTGGLMPTAIPPNFTPGDGIWGDAFQILFSVADDPDATDSDPADGHGDTASGTATPMVTASPADQVMLGTVGLAPVTDTAGTEYGVVVTPLATRSKSQDAVTITITPVDKAGNEGISRMVEVELTAGGGPTVTPAMLTAAPVSGSTVAEGATITLTFDKAPGTVTVKDAADMAVTVGGSGTSQTITAPTTAGAVTYTVTWANGGTATLTYTVRAREEVPATIMVPAESYVIVSKSGSAMGLPSPLPMKSSEVAWAEIPNLENLLYTGGTLILTVEKAASDALIDHDDDDSTDARQYALRDLVITEIMWALNNAEIGKPGATAHQWIEIYNNLKVPVTATIKAQGGQPAPTAADTDVLLDRVSNVVGARWQLTGLGQNGFDDDTADDTGKDNEDFISMYRKERGKDGHVKGHWAQSTEIYLADHKGTPGTKERSQIGTRDATTFDVGPVIFNEISNRSADDYEWFELRNKSGDEQNLKNRRISIVTAVGSDTWLFDVGDADLKIPSQGVLLFVFMDPSGNPDHPLAAGWNVAKNAANQVNGINENSPRYIVLKDDGKRKYNEDALGDEGFPEEFVLILRTRAHGDDVGKPSNIWDIAGYSKQLKVSADEAGFTNLWPLVGGVRNAELSNNKWVEGEVHRRQKDNVWGTSSTNYGRNDGNHADDTAWRDAGYTGIGYKRSAAVDKVNGGTPGYANNTSKSADAAALDPVIISEIMYDSSRRLPQWIEIMNTSTTVGVNLTNWAIDIVNHAENADGTNFEDAPLSTRIKFWDHDSPNGSFQLPPRQTMLIVSTGTRNNTTNLPNGRILNLRKGVGPKLLNPNGFDLTLVAKANEGDANKHQFGDSAGNLADPSTLNSRRADAQSFAPIAWELPSGTTDDGDRVSISRRTSSKVMDSSGMIEGNWIRSDMYAPVNNTRPATHYGTSSDIGSPGHVIGGALPVSLSKFRPERMKDTGQIVIRWITESELNNAGFNILRSEKRDGEFTKINTKLIAGQGTTSERTSYEYADTSAKPNVIYYYQIQDVSLDGQVTTLRTTHLRGNVTAVGKATTTWGDIKALQ